MKRITMLILLMVCAIGYSQSKAKSMGTDSNQKQNKQAVVTSNVSNGVTKLSEIKQEDRPVVQKKQQSESQVFTNGRSATSLGDAPVQRKLSGTVQYIYENPEIYGSRTYGAERQAPKVSVENQQPRVQNLGNRAPQATLLTEGFDDITTLPGAGYSFVNVSDVVGTTNWFQGNSTVFPGQSGGATSYIGANFNNTAGSVINNFMITPVLNLENGDEITFWTRSPTGSTFPDRLEVRLDPTGANTDPSGPASVGSYTELLLEINPNLTVGGYPDVWTEFTATVTGLSGAVNTRVAFRYWVTDGGPVGNNSDYIGIDTLTIEEAGGGGPFPDPYCGPLDFTNNVEPITLVEVAGISNVTSAVLNGTPDHEDFTAISGDMETGMSYPIALEGNTDGNFTNRFVVFIDWDQNGVLNDAGEVYEITDLLINSTGTDGQQSNGTIDVPAGALAGTTRMRVKKQFGTINYLDPCLATAFGQAEDYSINVTTGGSGGACANAVIEVNQDITNTCMANVTQTGLAQSYIPLEAESAGAGIMFETASTGLDVDLSLWDGLPNAGGTMLASGTSQTDGTVWTDVFWDPVVNVTVGNTYYIVIDGDPALPCIAGDTTNPYPGGNVFANPGYQPFPTFDYTFRTYSCDGGGGTGCTAGVYTDRAAFDTETGPINLEDFAGGPGAISQCGEVISNAGESCFAAGEILPGIEITSNNSAGGQTVYVDPSDGFGNTVPIVGSNTFVDYTIINFPDNNVNSFGFDLITLLGTGPVEVRIFGAGGLIDTQVVTGTNPETFWGYIASETIVRVELEDLTGVNIEGIGMLAFGDCSGGGSTYDDCSGAIALACGDSVVGETLTATDSGGNPAPDVFYKFTGSGTSQLVTISLCGGGTDYDSLIRVFDDCDLLNELAFNDDSCGLQSEVTFTSDGTSTYYIMVEGFGSNSGNFSLDVSCEDPLPNDGCSGAIAVACGDSVTGSTVGATIDTAPTCGTPITSPGVWYKLNDNSGLPGDITLSLCNGTDFDSKISVYSGTCAALVCVDGNDDACGLQSEISFASDGNTEYYILIHSFGGATGNFTMDVTCTPTPPPNDMIVNSIDVDEIGFPYTDPAVAMPAATTEDGNPVNCDLTGANGVWYNFVPTGDGTANATIVTPGGASSVTFYTAPDENAVETDLTLVPQQTNQCAPGTSASIFTLAGQAYYVFVMNTGAITDIVIDGTNLSVSDNTIAGFSYYPNPTNGILNLKSVDNIENVSLYNLLGQLVIENRVNATTSQMDITGLSTGTYLMKVTVNGVTGTYKVLKQ